MSKPALIAKSRPGGSPPLLAKLNRVSMQYASGTLALTETSLDLAEGEFIAVVGPSGCGKSSLLKLISGLHPPRAER